MWPNFKIHIIIAFFLLPILSVGQNTDGLIFNLKQNWVQYDKAAESFMPAISQSSGNTISFLLDGEKFKGKTLFINNSNQAYLFYDKVLLQEYNAGTQFVNIDSLIEATKTSKPILTLFGKNVKSNLTTLVVNDLYVSSNNSETETHIKDKNYTSFFILGSILLLGWLIFIKYNSQDLFSQYANIFRAFNFTTIDEIIYKGSFFINPSVQFIAWISFSAAFIFYYLVQIQNIHFLEIDWISRYSMLFHFVHLLILATGFFLLYAIRFMLISLMSLVFDLGSIRNIHFATHLRLTFYLLVALQVLITLAYFTVIPINTLLILIISLISLFTIIVLTGIRLSFIVRHPFVQIFLYLCGTEIFLFVFVFMLVVG